MSDELETDHPLLIEDGAQEPSLRRTLAEYAEGKRWDEKSWRDQEADAWAESATSE